MKKAAIFLVLMLCISFSSFTADASDFSASVRIAPFYTEINYMSVDNRYVEYPLIIYKNITYFPMTFDLCTELGLMCGYDSEN